MCLHTVKSVNERKSMVGYKIVYKDRNTGMFSTPLRRIDLGNLKAGSRFSDPNEKKWIRSEDRAGRYISGIHFYANLGDALKRARMFPRANGCDCCILVCTFYDITAIGTEFIYYDYPGSKVGVGVARRMEVMSIIPINALECKHEWVQLPTYDNDIEEGFARCLYCGELVEDKLGEFRLSAYKK